MFGELEFAGKDMSWPAVKCDRIAVNGEGHLLFVSIVAHESIVKGVRGALSSDKQIAITATDLLATQASRPDYERRLQNFTRMPGGYREDTHRLGFNMYHAFFISKAFGVLLSTGEDHLWAHLNGEAFTTPLLREWLPWVKARLLAKEMLKEAWCVGCEAGALVCTTKDLDEIVTDGLSRRALTIPGEAA